jgi:hypothetical protein
MPLRFDDETGWTYHQPRPIPYADPGGEPEPYYSLLWPHDLIDEANALISTGMDSLKAIHMVDERHLKRKNGCARFNRIP